MRKRTLALLLLLAVAVGSASLALRAEPAKAGLGTGDPDPYQGTRYRVRVTRVDLPPSSTGRPLRLSDFETDIPRAVVPMAAHPAAHGHFGAIPYRADLGAAIPEGLGAEVLFRGETESSTGKKCSIVQGQRFPVQNVQVRGDARTLTTSFEKVGIAVQLTPNRSRIDGDPTPDLAHPVKVDLSAISAFTAEGLPVISQFSSEGVIVLPDAYTSILSFVERVPGEVLGKGTGGADAPPADVFVQYFVMITRLDLTSK